MIMIVNVSMTNLSEPLVIQPCGSGASLSWGEGFRERVK